MSAWILTLLAWGGASLIFVVGYVLGALLSGGD